MNAYTLLVLVVIFIYSTARPIDLELPNVGTVLFSDKDLHKKFWTKADIALLQARRHLQNLIPPSELISPSYNFVDTLVDYFKQSFTCIKNTASSAEEDSILTTALSDIIGGYLKLWILPTTKFAFYSGTINQDQAFRVFSLYDEIRKYLQTDGSGWRNPDYRIIKSIVLNIPQTMPQHAPQFRVRSTNADPCEIFAYFEKTPNGFTIPLPYINWEQNTMFVPLKNHPLVHLSSSNYSNTLINYYTAAKSCLKRRSPNITNKFDEKVQSWLFQTVLPHLTDDHLYLALGSVLMLFNDTGNLYSTCPWEDALAQSQIPYFGPKKCSIKCHLKCYFTHVWQKVTGMFACMWRHKLVTLTFLLLVEILWCMFAINRLDIQIKDKPFCFCKKICLFFSERGCHMPKKGPPDDSDNDGDDDSKNLNSNKVKRKKGKSKESFSSEDTSKKDKKGKKAKKKSSSSSDKSKKDKTKSKKAKSEKTKKGKTQPDFSEKTTSTSKFTSELKCDEKCKPCHFLDRSTSDTLNSKLTSEKSTSQETTAERTTRTSSSSGKLFSNACSLKESELEKILCCPEKGRTIVTANQSSESDKSKSDQSATSSSQSKSNETAQNEVKSNKFTDTRIENKIGQMRTVDVKYSQEIKLSGIKLDVIPKLKRRIDVSDTPLSKQQMHVAYSTIASGSRACIPSVYDIIKEVSSRSRNLPPECDAPHRARSKKVNQSETSKSISTQGQENVVTLFQKQKISSDNVSVIRNGSPLEKSISKCVSKKTPFSTLHESSSSLMSELSHVCNKEKSSTNISRTERNSFDTPQVSTSTLVYDPNKPEREIKSHTYDSLKMDTVSNTKISLKPPLKEETCIKFRKTDIISQVTAVRVDEQMTQSRLERARSRLLQDFRQGEDSIIKYKENTNKKEEITEPRKEVSKVPREFKPKPKNTAIDTHQRHRIKQSKKTNDSVEDTKTATAISREQEVFVTKEQQETYKESKDEKCSTEKHIMPKAMSQRESKRSSRDSYLEIKIERPNAEISVGVTGSMVGRIEKPLKHIITRNKGPMPHVDKIEELARHVSRESRIPKRATPGSHSLSPDPKGRLPESSATKPKSKIPQLKKQAVDDIAIKIKKPPGKLNVTL